MIVFGQNPPVTDGIPNEVLVRWVSERLGIKDFGPCVTIGVVHKGEIAAVALYNHWNHPSIEVTFVTSSPRWASPGAVRAILSYPFKQLNCRRITATTKATNEVARKFLLRLGFKQEGVIRDAFDDTDAIVHGMLRSEAARWL